jgi:hypothetical protein
VLFRGTGSGDWLLTAVPGVHGRCCLAGEAPSRSVLRSSHSLAHDTMHLGLEQELCCILLRKTCTALHIDQWRTSPIYIYSLICETQLTEIYARSHTTYYDRRLRQGPALVRARRPYLFKNALTGLGLFALVGGVCKLMDHPYPVHPTAMTDAVFLFSLLQTGIPSAPLGKTTSRMSRFRMRLDRRPMRNKYMYTYL